MLGKLKDSLSRGVSIKTYVALWVGTIFASCLILALAWNLAESDLQRMTDHIFSDANDLDTGRALELHLLAERREDLLWRATQDEAHRANRDAELLAVEQVASTLGAHPTTRTELQIVEDIQASLQAFRARARAQPPPPIRELHNMADDLLATAHRYIDQNRSDMDATLEDARALHTSVRRWAIGLMLFVVVILTIGSLGLINRVVRPTLELTRAARRFGQGDFAARAAIARDDELGALCHTFNGMAQDIEDHEKERLDFVAMVAHDLKTPLITIGGSARMLRKHTLPPERENQWLDRMIRQVTRLENMTQDLMDSVQVATGRLTLDMTDLDLAELIATLRREQADAFATHNLVFEGDQECWVRGDASRLERVALNLISNAAKYSPKGSTVLARVERRGSLAALVVRDQGAGISPEDLEMIFQPFGRTGRARAMARGTGLGLSIVKRIVEAHRGSIRVESELETGTTVEVLLPLIPGPGEGGHSERAPADPKN